MAADGKTGGTFHEIGPKFVTIFQTLTADISLDNSRTAVIQPPKLMENSGNYESEL